MIKLKNKNGEVFEYEQVANAVVGLADMLASKWKGQKDIYERLHDFFDDEEQLKWLMEYGGFSYVLVNLTLGDMVRIRENSPSGGGERAYVYDTYSDFDMPGEVGVCLITESGNDTGGWSKMEQAQFLEPLPRTYYQGGGWDYQFTNVIKLDQDFKAGVFDKVFKTNGQTL